MRKLISILGLVLVVGFGYFALAQYIETAHGQSSNSLLVPAESAYSNTSATGAQVLALLNRLQNITLDDSIFKSPAFANLQDWTVTITPQQVGRSNPYLPAFGAPASSAKVPKVSLPRR